MLCERDICILNDSNLLYFPQCKKPVFSCALITTLGNDFFFRE